MHAHVNATESFQRIGANLAGSLSPRVYRPDFARKSYHVSHYELVRPESSSDYTSSRASRPQSADSRSSTWKRAADSIAQFSEDEASKQVYDILYQRGFLLKQICRSLDKQNTGRVPRQELRQCIISQLRIVPANHRTLDAILDSAMDGPEVSVRQLMNVVQAAAKADMRNDNRERFRFAAPGIMYAKMQSMLTVTKGDIGLANRRPVHAIGECALNPPYGIEGDAERMECIINAYMEDRSDKIQLTFHRYDSNNDGKLTYVEFTKGMLDLDPEMPKPSIEDLIAVLDPDHKGQIWIRDIREKFSVEFMKLKSQRGAAGHTCRGDSITQWPLSTGHFPSKEEMMAMTRMRAKCSPRYNPQNTRAEKMRLEAIKAQLAEVDPLRAERMAPQSNLKSNTTLRSELKMSGVLPIIPAPPADRRKPMTHRAPPAPHRIQAS